MLDVQQLEETMLTDENRVLIDTDVLRELVDVYKATRQPEVAPGDIVTWAHGVVSTRVISNDQSGLVIETEGGQKQVWSGLRRPVGLRKLPSGTSVGPLGLVTWS